MSATEGLRCSECGYEAKREKKLFKTHRKWRWAFVAIGILIAGHITNTMPRIQKAGWIGTVPTTALIYVFPWQHKMRWSTTLAYREGWAEGITSELERRINADETWRWQNHRLAWKTLDHFKHDILESPSEITWQLFRLFEDIGEDASIVHPQLVELLKSKNTAIVVIVGYLLSLHQTDDPAILYGIAALFEHDDEWVRERATYYIVGCAKHNPDYVIPKLSAAMKDPSIKVCYSAIDAAMMMGTDGYELMPAIEEFTRHENKQLQDRARIAILELQVAKLQSSQQAPGYSK